MYAELHLHTSYSLLDGASQPAELALRAKEVGYQALAVTDHDSLGGAMEFAQACKAEGIQPITGAELTLADGSHLTLLAESRTGYGNLCRLITDLKHGWEPAGVTLDDEPADPADPAGTTVPLADYAEGLILLTGCRLGLLGQLADQNRREDARRVLMTYLEWFGQDNVFVELQHHRVRGDTQRLRRLVALAREVGVPCVVTGNVHYHRQRRHALQDVLVAIRHTTTLDGCHRQRKANSGFYLRAPETMAERFQALPDAIAATETITRRCAAFDLTEDLGYTFPDFDNGTGETAEGLLARRCWEALTERYPPGSPRRERAIAQLEDELHLIRTHELSGFFLVYADLLRMAREIADDLRSGVESASRRFLPPGRGRGSAVSSIVCYLIGLSPIDPLRHELYVGRFLNDTMASVPDIDIDFPREIRERMIERVYTTYGRDYTAMVSAYATYRLPSAVRDIGKALGLPAWPTVATPGSWARSWPGFPNTRHVCTNLLGVT